MILGWPFSKTVHKILISQETWLWWMGATCTIWKWRNSQKFFSSETPGQILKQFDRDVPWVILALVNGGYLHYMDMMKFLKILFLWNPWADFKRNFLKCSLGDPFQNLFVNFDPSRNMALVDGGYLLLYRNEEFLKILLFETDGQISKWILQVTFWKLLS